MDHVHISIPTRDSIKAETVLWMLSQHHTSEYSISFDLIIGGMNIEAQRNSQVLKFLEHEPATHLFLLDADVQPPIDAIEILLRDKVDIVSGIYPVHVYNDVVYCAFGRVDETHLYQPHSLPANPKLDEVAGIGMGCTLISRGVFETIPAPWFGVDPDMYGNPSTTEDLWFCDRAKDHGFKVHADWRVMCTHYKMIPLRREVYGISTEQHSHGLDENTIRLMEGIFSEFTGEA